MRLSLMLALLTLSFALGCSTSAGRSPAQIESAHASAGFVARDYAPMQAQIP